MKVEKLKELAREHGTPLFVIDHAAVRGNYAEFRRYLPRVQGYYAVKANSDPEIIKTLYGVGASFDVASIAEFNLVYENIRNLPAKERQDFIWDKIIYSHPIKDQRTLEELDQYKPLVAFDNAEEIKKIRRHAPHAGLVLRIRVPNTGSMVELSSKFGSSSIILSKFSIANLPLRRGQPFCSAIVTLRLLPMAAMLINPGNTRVLQAQL